MKDFKIDIVQLHSVHKCTYMYSADLSDLSGQWDSVLSESCHCDNPFVSQLTNSSRWTGVRACQIFIANYWSPIGSPINTREKSKPKDSFIFLASLARANMFSEAWHVVLQKALYWLTTAHVSSRIRVPKPTLFTFWDIKTNKARNPTTVYF